MEKCFRTKLILTLHTITEWDLVGRIKGQTDIRLNPRGKVQARKLAKTLSNLGIILIISSDLRRASETAEIINSVLQVPLQIERGLRECSFGKIEGLTKQQAIDRYGPSIVKHWEDQSLSYDFRPFDGECCNDVLARYMEILNLFSTSNPDDTILLVGHSRALNTLLAELGYSPDLKLGEYRIIEYNHRR